MTDSDDVDRTISPNNRWLELERAEKVPEIVARKILRSIVRNGMVAGDRLPAEGIMLSQLGVGRASLREALRILETHGLIRIKPGPHGGPVVTEMTPSDYGQTTTLYLHRSGATFRELIEARLVFEPVMARLAAKRLSKATADRLRAATRRGWDALDGDQEDWSAAVEEFHSTIAAGSGNGVLDLYCGALVSIERHRLGPLFADRESREPTLRIHDRIAEAVLDGDSERAEELSRRHIIGLAQVWHEQFARHLDDIVEWK